MKLSYIFLFLWLGHYVQAQGFDIKAYINNSPSDTMYLGYYYADKQYLRDTAIKKDGYFHFKNDRVLESGIYLLVMPPKNDFIQLFINEGETNLIIHADAADVVKSFKIEGSKDNEIFYDYLNYLEIQRPRAQGLAEKLKSADDASRVGIQSQIENINEEVKARQQKIISDNPQSISAILVKSTLEVPMIEFTGSKEEVDLKRYLYYKSHYFDNLNLGDPRLLRSPLMNERLNYYIEKLTPQDPDSINVSLDYLLKKLLPAEESFKFYLIQWLNKYAGSDIVGFDGIYVHLVDEYYSKGFTPWIDAEQLEKLEKNAAGLRPILIGKTAPEIKIIRYPEQTPISLYSIQSPYTILVIWDPECSHCKASLPYLVKFYEKYKSRGVEILAVCSQFTDKVPSCWKYLDDQNMHPGWINAADPLHVSKYKVLYNVKSTPQIFVLNKEKKIISKGVGAEKLDELMDHVIQEKM
ncbi:MAG: DUF4369 domain-containing protein [Saprospiraceae bacterium]